MIENKSDGSRRIYAPVGLASTAQVLGVNAVDTYKVCCATEKINPYSLIRPLYFKTGPYKSMEFFAKPSPTPSLADYIPQAELTKYNSPVGYKIKSLPSASQFDKTVDDSAVYLYALKQWGYVVPYVIRVDHVIAFLDLWWHRFGPGDATNENPWCVLDHFDGYIHNADAAKPYSVDQTHFVYGEVPTYTPQVLRYESDKYKVDDILGGVGNKKNHPGGIVNVPAVIGADANLHYGISAYTRSSDSTTSKWKFLACNIAHSTANENPNPSDPNAPRYPGGILKAVTLGKPAVNKAEYLIIPWICKGTLTGVDSNGLPTFANGAEIYPMRYDEKMEGWFKAEIIPKLPAFMTYMGSNAVSLSYETIKVGVANVRCIKVEFALVNGYADYPMEVSRFRFAFKEHVPTDSANTTKDHTNNPVQPTSVKIGGEYVSSKVLYHTQKEAGVGPTGIAMIYGVELYFPLAGDYYELTGQWALSFRATDGNHAIPIGTDIKISSYGMFVKDPPKAALDLEAKDKFL